MRWVVGTFFVCMILPFIVWSQARESHNCQSFPDVRVSVTSVFADPAYDFSTGIPEIQSLADVIVHQVRVGWALGFTQTKPLLEMDAPVMATPAGHGQFCARPRYINVTLGTQSETVSIPREIPPESCAFKEVMEHEAKHQEINRKMVLKYATLARQKFADYVRGNPPIEAGDLGQAVAVQQNVLRSMLDEIAMDMIAENAALQHTVDSPEEYDRLLHVCHGELADIVKHARETRWFAQRG